MTEFIDPAFSRRFIFHVKFEVPSKETRLLIWRNLGAPLAHLFDFSVVAEKYELSGGEIKNVILKAMAYGISTLSELENICETQMNERTGEANKVIGIS